MAGWLDVPLCVSILDGDQLALLWVLAFPNVGCRMEEAQSNHYTIHDSAQRAHCYAAGVRNPRSTCDERLRIR